MSANKRKRRVCPPPRPSAHSRLRFSPYAWAKLLFLRDAGPTEIGGFGVSAEGDLLSVEDIQLVKQTCSATRVSFDDNDVANFFDFQVDQGRMPERFGRLWIHTHPDNDPRPSAVDEETFRRVFGDCNWAVMVILAKGDEAYCRLQFNIGPKGSMRIPVEVDYRAIFAGSDTDMWHREYKENITVEKPRNTRKRKGPLSHVRLCDLDFTEPREYDLGYGGFDDDFRLR